MTAYGDKNSLVTRRVSNRDTNLDGVLALAEMSAHIQHDATTLTLLVRTTCRKIAIWEVCSQ